MSDSFPPIAFTGSTSGDLRQGGTSMKYVVQPSSATTSPEKKSLSKSLRKTFASISQHKTTADEISQVVKQLDKLSKDEMWSDVEEILKDDLKPMLISYINQHQSDLESSNNHGHTADNGAGGTSSNNKTLPIIIDKNLGPVTVEILRHNLNTNESLVKECAGVLYLLSILNPNFKKAVARLFQAMHNYPSNLDLLEDSTLAIQNCVTQNPDSHIRIAPSLPTLYQAIIKHSTRSEMLVGAALNILEDLAYNPEMNNNKYLSQSVPALLKILELPSEDTKIQSCRILAELSHPQQQQIASNSSGKQNYQQNTHSQIGLQIHLLLACCKDSSPPDLKATAMQVIANVSVHTPSHKGFIHRRAIPQIIKLLTASQSSEDCRYQSCRAIANLTIPQLFESVGVRKTAAPTVIESGGITALIKTMTRYSDEVLLQIQASIAIQNLCKLSGGCGGSSDGPNNSPTASGSFGGGPSSPTSPMSPSSMKYGAAGYDYIMDDLKKSGAIPAVLTALKIHKTRKDLEVFANRALYLLLQDRSSIEEMIEYINDTSSNGGTGLSVVLKGMTYHATSASVQISALKTLSRLQSQDDFELLLSEGGLDVLLTIVFNFCGADVVDDSTSRAKHHDDIRHREICLLTCDILKQFTKPVPGSEKSIQQSLDLQRAVASKEGIPILLIIIEKHGSSSKKKSSSSSSSSEGGNLQESALACMRNIVLHPSNRLLIDDAAVATLMNCLLINKPNAAIQAYGFDTLGRLATLAPPPSSSSNANQNDVAYVDNNSSLIKIRRAINSERGIQLSIEALQAHAMHPGVQDRVVFFLVQMTDGSEIETLASYENLLKENPLPLLTQAKSRMPPKGQERLRILIQRVQQKQSGADGSSNAGGGLNNLQDVGGKLMGFFGGGGGT